MTLHHLRPPPEPDLPPLDHTLLLWSAVVGIVVGLALGAFFFGTGMT